MHPRVKICCISSIEEASQAVRYGASAVGLVSHMPSGPGILSDHLIAEIVRTVPPPIATFLLTSRRDADAIADQHSICGTTTLQLTDAVPRSELHKLRKMLPHVKLVQVIHVLGEESMEEALEAQTDVDALLLDSGNPNLLVKELGGTGRAHDWNVSQAICSAVKIPVFLAGGLQCANVAEAIRRVQPFGLDLCSGVRTEGRLDVRKLDQFMRAVQSAT